MKKLLSILLLFLSVKGVCQFPVNSTNGTATTTNLTRGIAAADSGFQYRSYFLDTASANRGRIDEVPGVMIRTAPNVIWLRNSTATAWIRQANINDIINITGCYALLNGGLVSWSGSGLTMDVSAADYLINCKEYSTITSQVTLSTADATYDRFDIIYVDTNSTVGVITGTASATPIFPQIDPASQLQLAVISVPAGATTPGDVSSIVIYNEDIEWTSGSIMSSGTVDFVSTNNPFIGTYNALMSANANGVIYWDTANPININDYTTLKMYVRIDGGFDNDLAAYLVYLRSGGNPITNPIYLTDYGLDLSISGSYQIVTIPITAFTFAGSSSDVFDGVQLKFNNGSAALHIDYVQLQGGIPNGNSPYITNIFRVPGVDSIYFTKNGINYAIKDSIGSGGGSSYTFPYSVVAPGNAIQLENDTTANPANYFYGRNSAGRRGWYPQSGITNWANSNLTLTGNREHEANNNGITIHNLSGLNYEINDGAGYTGTIGFSGDLVDNSYHIFNKGSNGNNEAGIDGFRSTNKFYSVSDGDSSFVQTDGVNGISIKAFDGSLRIPLLNYTLSTTGKKIMLRDTLTGDVWNIDPALIGGGGSSLTFTSPLNESGGVVNLGGLSGYGTSGQILSSTGTGLQYINQSSITGVNIYNSNGQATANRVFIGNGKTLNFNNFVGVTFDTSKVTIRTSTGFDAVGDSSFNVFNGGIHTSRGVRHDNLPYTLNITGKKISVIDTANGGTMYTIDPALIGGGGISGLTTNELVYGNSATTIASLSVATYPSLTELSYVKGVTSSIQTQLDTKISASSTNTLTNKRWTARVGSTTSSATPTINTDNYDIYKLTAQTADITSFTTNLSGTPVDGDILEIQVTGTAARAITWGASFVSSTVTLPATTVTTATLTVILQYYTTSSYGNNKWVCVNYY